MKTKKYLLICYVFIFTNFLNSAFSQTTISGGYVSGTWTQANSPYQIFGDIFLGGVDSILIIEPGVIVEFQGSYQFSVGGGGKLIAVGTETENIIFTVNDTTGFCDTSTTDGGWLGILICSTPYSHIEYCIFEYGKKITDLNYTGVIQICFFGAGNILIANCIIRNNISLRGSGIYCGSSAYIINNTIVNNYAIYSGGGIYIYQCSPTITNNTICNNKAIAGGGIYIFCNLCSPTITNTIIYGNEANYGNQIHAEVVNLNFYNCNIEGGLADFYTHPIEPYPVNYENNIDSDPQFVSPSSGAGISYDSINADWSLQETSPCINAGTPDTTGLNLPATDIAGNPRIYDCVIDIGAYEYQDSVNISFGPLTDVCENLSAFQLTTSFPGGTCSGTGVTNNFFYPTLAGEGIHTISFSSGCDTTTLTQDINVLPAPVVNLEPDTIHTSQPDTIVLDAGAGSDIYLWHDGSTNQTFQVTDYGWCYITATFANGCEDLDSIFIDYPFMVNDLANKNSQIYIYPNPNNGNFTISLKESTKNIHSIEITDILGSTVYKKEKIQTNAINIDISNHLKGIYFVKIFLGDKVLVEKIILN